MIATAQLICIMCDVRQQCDDFRKRTSSGHGVWGGEHVKRGE